MGRKLSQHFLADRGVAQRIVDLLGDAPARVLEIGPGRGALTGPLLERFGRVLALELDGPLVDHLRRRFAGAPLEVRQGDAVREPLAPLLAGEAPWQVASNLPYASGTPILRRLLPHHELFARIVVMLQREVAERVVARPGDRNHGLLALERAAWAEARLALRVPPRAFRPPPRVDSAVLVLAPRPAPYPAEDLARALAIAAAALLHPRKTLANALGRRFDAAAFAAAGLDPGARPATVPLHGWAALAGVVPFER